MSKLLYLIAHPSPGESRSVRVAEAFRKRYLETHPMDRVEVLDLYAEPLPLLGAVEVRTILKPNKPDSFTPEEAAAWEKIESLIGHFASFDKYLLAVPMWNFSIPPRLKNYLDHLVQAGLTFRYTATGAEGLLGEKPIAIVSARGGFYEQPPFRDYEYCFRYLEAIFGFIGLKVAASIPIEGMNVLGAEEREAAIEAAIARAREVAERF